MPDRAQCQALDDADPLAGRRSRFRIPDGLVYLDGNSLGPLPEHVPERMARLVEHEWAGDLITSWNVHGWADLPLRVGDRIARLIGAPPGTVVASDSTSVNLFKVVSAARRMTDRPVILSDTGNFPTDLYVMSSISELRVVEPDAVADSIADDVGVVALTQVGYATGRRHDMARLTALAHDAGALVVWDLAHSAGAMPIDLGRAEFAVGCGYKYLNGGPGAPAFAYVREDVIGRFRNPVTGWFGHAAPFDFALDFVPADGIDRARVGTPHVLSLAALDSALDVFDDVDLALVRAKSVALSELFIELVDELVPDLRLVSPRDPADRGSQLCWSHPHGYAIVQALVDRRVIGDFRAPDVLRFGLAPLYVRYVDVYDAAVAMADVITSETYRDERFAVRNPVT